MKDRRLAAFFFRAAWRRVPVCPKWFIRKPLIDGYVRDKHSIFSPTDALFYCGNNIISLTWKNKHPIFHVESENRVLHSIHWLINMFFHFSINYENNHFHPIFVMLPVISESQHVLTYLRAWWCNIRICSLFTPLWSLYIYIYIYIHNYTSQMATWMGTCWWIIKFWGTLFPDKPTYIYIILFIKNIFFRKVYTYTLYVYMYVYHYYNYLQLCFLHNFMFSYIHMYTVYKYILYIILLLIANFIYIYILYLQHIWICCI